MFCTNCGAQLPEDAVFCTVCGEKLMTETPGGGQEPTLSQPKKRFGSSKGVKIAAIGVAAVLLGGLAIGMVVGNNPKTVILRGFTKTWEAAGTEESGLNSYLGLEKLRESVRSGQTKQTMELDMLADAVNFGLKSELKKNGSEFLLADAQLTIGSAAVIDGSLYHDTEKTIAMFPKIYSKAFYLNHEELKEKLSSTPYLAQINNYFNLNLRKMDVEDYDFSKIYWDMSGDNWKTLYKNMKVDKLEKKTFSIGGKDKKCKGYQITIDKSDLKNVIEDLTDASIESGVLINAASTAYWSSPEEIKQDLRDMSKNMTASIKKDLELQVYIGPKGRIVSISGEYPFNDRGRIFTLKGSMEMTGPKNPLDNLEIQIESASGAALVSQISLLRTLEDTNDKIKDTVEIAFQESGYINSRAITSVNMEVDKKRGSWNADFGMQRSGYTSSAFAEGTIENVKKGQSFTATLDDVGVTSYGSSVPLVNMSASYTIEPLKDKIEETLSEEPQVNILQLSDLDMNAIGEEILMNMYTGYY